MRKTCWQEKMIDFEMRTSENLDFQIIAFFRHLLFQKI